MSAPVFLAEPGALDGVRAGDTYVLTGTEGRHAAVVQRRRAGERVDVADGAGVRLECVVSAADGDRLVMDVLAHRVEEPPMVPLVLVQALAKGDRDDLAVEAATEVGVDEVVPWQAERSVVVWRGDRAERSRAKWVAAVRQAAKQSRRAHVPAVRPVVDSRALADEVRTVVADGGAALVLHEEATEPIGRVALPQAGPVLVVVGPEGGIGEEELGRLTAAGAVAVRLGPHVLRTSTAGPVALAVLAQRLGRWG